LTAAHQFLGAAILMFEAEIGPDLKLIEKILPKGVLVTSAHAFFLAYCTHNRIGS
jgi:hypothetical protein